MFAQPLLTRFYMFCAYNRLRYGQNLTKFCIHIIIDKIYVGIVNRHFFCEYATELRSLIDVRIQSFFQYLENE